MNTAAIGQKRVGLTASREKELLGEAKKFKRLSELRKLF